jgi:hypothetical protein
MAAFDLLEIVRWAFANGYCGVSSMTSYPAKGLHAGLQRHLLCYIDMATTDQRTRDLAQVIHENYGDEAVAVALERVRNWREAEDGPMAALWMRVAEECRKLAVWRGDRRFRLPQISLLERMDRPALNAVKLDDADRRREFVATLTQVTRKYHD